MNGLCFLEWNSFGVTSVHLAFFSNNRLFLSEDFHLHEAIMKKGILLKRCDYEDLNRVLLSKKYKKISFEEFKIRFDIKSFHYELNKRKGNYKDVFFRTLSLKIKKKV